jgi:hypothetical protein
LAVSFFFYTIIAHRHGVLAIFEGRQEQCFDSFFLYHFDHPRLVLVSKPLNGDNYSTWCRSMTISLNAKSKLSFIDGTIEMMCAKSQPDDHAS